jgi:hypothetical protein
MMANTSTYLGAAVFLTAAFLATFLAAATFLGLAADFAFGAAAFLYGGRGKQRYTSGWWSE